MAKPIVYHNPRTIDYHESAIVYNKKMAECARELVISDDLTDKDVKRWCMAQAQQHEQHIPHHERAVKRLREEEKQKEQKNKGRNYPKHKGPKPSSSKRKEQVTETTDKTPARPIPRDPRAPKKIYTDNPIDRDAVEMHTPGIDPMDADTNGLGEDPANEQQEAS